MRAMIVGGNAYVSPVIRGITILFIRRKISENFVLRSTIKKKKYRY
jgi:hypothetical protein